MTPIVRHSDGSYTIGTDWGAQRFASADDAMVTFAEWIRRIGAEEEKATEAAAKKVRS